MTYEGVPAKRRNGAKRTMVCSVLILGLPVQSPHSRHPCAHSKNLTGSVARSCSVILTRGDSMALSSELTERQSVCGRSARE